MLLTHNSSLKMWAPVSHTAMSVVGIATFVKPSAGMWRGNNYFAASSSLEDTRNPGTYGSRIDRIVSNARPPGCPFKKMAPFIPPPRHVGSGEA